MVNREREESDRESGSLRVGLAAQGSVRWAAADLTGPLRVARDGLDLSPLATAALGRCLTGAALLSRLALKTPVRFVLDLTGDGPLRKVLAEVDPGGTVRGMVGEPQADLPPLESGDLDVGGGIGSGQLRVWRRGKRSSYQSQVELQTGSVGQALTHYLHQSDQTRSAILLGVLLTPRGVDSAGGLIVEVLPGASEEVIRLLEDNVARVPSAGRLLAAEGLSGLRAALLADLESVESERTEVRYSCPCRRQKIGSYLSSLTPDEIEGLRADSGVIETECVFCGSLYLFGTAELAALSERGSPDPTLVN